MHHKTPFEKWWNQNIQQMAVSSEIKELIAKAFEGGRRSIEPMSEDDILDFMIDNSPKGDTVLEKMTNYIRAIERKHNIGGENG